MLGYVLLDYENLHGINAAAIYMARQGQLIRWSLTEFLDNMAGESGVSVVQARADFRQSMQPENKNTEWKMSLREKIAKGASEARQTRGGEM